MTHPDTMPIITKIVMLLTDETNARYADPSQRLNLGNLEQIITSSAASMVATVTQEFPQIRPDMMLSVAAALTEQAIEFQAGLPDRTLINMRNDDGSMTIRPLGKTGHA
jgi:hypothetical protein